MLDIGNAVREWRRRSRVAAAEDRFEAMAAALHVDFDALPPALHAEAVARCAACDNAGACGKWLRTGIWTGSEAPCPNAPLFRRPRWQPPAGL